MGFDVAWAVDDVGEDLAADVGGEAEEGGVLLVECGGGVWWCGVEGFRRGVEDIVGLPVLYEVFDNHHFVGS